MKKNQSKEQVKSLTKVIHIPCKLHSKLILHTALKKIKLEDQGKITLSKEVSEAIDNHISRQGYV